MHVLCRVLMGHFLVFGSLFALDTAWAAEAPPASILEIQSNAAAGNAAAQFKLGTLYYMGLGEQQDWAVAVDWLRKSAQQGNADAQCELGMIYQIGSDGVVQDTAEAVKWYSAAAKQDDGAADLGLAGVYAADQRAFHNDQLAGDFLRRAAIAGFAPDTSSPPLGQLYRHFLTVATEISPPPPDGQIP